MTKETEELITEFKRVIELANNVKDKNLQEYLELRCEHSSTKMLLDELEELCMYNQSY